MTPAVLRTLRLLQGQIAGAQAHLSEAVLRLRALENTLADVGTAVVVSAGMDATTAAMLAQHVEIEVQSLGIVNAQLSMCASLARVLVDS